MDFLCHNACLAGQKCIALVVAANDMKYNFLETVYQVRIGPAASEAASATF